MLSRDNRKEQLRKQDPKKQRFTIKKLTVGVASVLIGFTFMGVGAYASDNVTTESNNNADKSVVTGTTDQTAKSTANSQQSVEQAAATKTSNNAKTGATQESANQQTITLNTENKQVPVTANQVNANKQTTNSQEASDAQSFINALNDGNVGVIKVTKDIDFSNANASDLTLNQTGNARSVVIESEKNNTLTFGNNAVVFNNSNQNNTDKSWNITLSNITIGKTGSKGIFDFSSNLSAANAAKNVITFKNVTSTIDTDRILSSAVTANFSGDNHFSSSLSGNSSSSTSLSGKHLLSGALFKVNGLNVLDGTTTVNVDNQKGDTTAFEIINGNAVVNSGATLNINSDSANFGGIYFDKGAGNQGIDAATVGVTRLESDAVVKR